MERESKRPPSPRFTVRGILVAVSALCALAVFPETRFITALLILVPLIILLPVMLIQAPLLYLASRLHDHEPKDLDERKAQAEQQPKPEISRQHRATNLALDFKPHKRFGRPDDF